MQDVIQLVGCFVEPMHVDTEEMDTILLTLADSLSHLYMGSACRREKGALGCLAYLPGLLMR